MALSCRLHRMISAHQINISSNVGSNNSDSSFINFDILVINYPRREWFDSFSFNVSFAVFKTLK